MAPDELRRDLEHLNTLLGGSTDTESQKKRGQLLNKIIKMYEVPSACPDAESARIAIEIAKNRVFEAEAVAADMEGRYQRAQLDLSALEKQLEEAQRVCVEGQDE